MHPKSSSLVANPESQKLWTKVERERQIHGIGCQMLRVFRVVDAMRDALNSFPLRQQSMSAFCMTRTHSGT